MLLDFLVFRVFRGRQEFLAENVGPHSALHIPHSALHIPHSTFRTQEWGEWSFFSILSTFGWMIARQ
jgi:hypothetical protein